MENKSIQEELAAKAIGMEVLRHLRQEGVLEGIAQETEARAARALEEIRNILENAALNDSECFQRIEAIIREFEKNGVGISRHDF